MPYVGVSGAAQGSVEPVPEVRQVLQTHTHPHQTTVNAKPRRPVQLQVVRQQRVRAGDGEVCAERGPLAHLERVEEDLLVHVLAQDDGHQAAVASHMLLLLPHIHRSISNSVLVLVVVCSMSVVLLLSVVLSHDSLVLQPPLVGSRRLVLGLGVVQLVHRGMRGEVLGQGAGRLVDAVGPLQEGAAVHLERRRVFLVQRRHVDAVRPGRSIPRLGTTATAAAIAVLTAATQDLLLQQPGTGLVRGHRHDTTSDEAAVAITVTAAVLVCVRVDDETAC